MQPQRIQPPRIRDEAPTARRARAILAHLAQDEAVPPAARLAALAAIGELEDDLPAGQVLHPITPIAGTFAEAVELLDQPPTEPAPAGRDLLAAARAAVHLQPWREPS